VVVEVVVRVVVVVVVVMMEGSEIGRDAGAFFSDLEFGFLLMHYIRENVISCFLLLLLLSLFLFLFMFVFEVLLSVTFVQRNMRE